MTTIFIIISAIVNLIFSTGILLKKYQKTIIVFCFLLSILSPAAVFFGNLIFQTPFSSAFSILFKTFLLFSTLVLMLLIQISTRLFNTKVPENSKISSRYNLVQNLLGYLICLAAIILFFLPDGAEPGWVDNRYLLILSFPGSIALSINLFCAVFLLYTVERTYRFAIMYQRRIARIYLLSLAVLAIFTILLLIRILLFKTIQQSYVDMQIIIQGICIPVFLYGLFRYRLSEEKITIPRGTVYASFTLLTTGAVLLGLGVAVYITRLLGISFTFFELFLILFSVLFLTVLVVGSPRMRQQVTRILLNRLYSSKYDYYQQFYRLYETYTTDADMHQTMNKLVTNMKETLTISNVYVFIQRSDDGNFYLHVNPDMLRNKNISISGDSPVALAFSGNEAPLDFANQQTRPRELAVLKQEEKLVTDLDISMIFPIYYRNSLLGLLAFKRTPGITFDKEDIKLINAFSTSIGDVFYKNKIYRERIEHKQFESFSHIASFVIHDIKNQVATLSLLTANAKKNINNPDFQKSLMSSLINCTANLQTLIDKFSSPLKAVAKDMDHIDINSVLLELITTTGLTALSDVHCTSVLEASAPVSGNRESLYYIFLNLITNALDAMNRKGKLLVSTGNIESLPHGLTQELGLSGSVLQSKKVFILIQDSGKGMTSEFIAAKLFHPFTSTKDKGIGIGLYQCKILLEKMGGKIMCTSELNQGSRFIVLL